MCRCMCIRLTNFVGEILVLACSMHHLSLSFTDRWRQDNTVHLWCMEMVLSKVVARYM